ncbi:MAG TPA: hypothetical protein ACFCUY_06920 [Xenococcaceae cyanobacterium]|jgi:uncharacterized membrane protein (DUF485 family)
MNSQSKKLDSSRLIDQRSQQALNTYVFSFKVPPKKFSLAALSQLNLWQTAGEIVSNSNHWQLSLIAIGSASSIIYAHVPLVGFAALAGNTLTRKKALITVSSIWFANQLYGFTIRQYPSTLESLTWGLVMGLGTLLITWLITLKPKFSRRSFRGYLLWLAIAVVGGYAIYQGSIVFIAQLMGGHGFSFTILWGIFLKDTVWAVVLSAIHSSLVWLVIQTIPNYYYPSFPPTYSWGYHPPGCGRKV